MENQNPFYTPNEWHIVFSKTMKTFQHCICGHRVKRITFLYHKPTKTIRTIGKTCVSKYGIKTKLSNRILIDVIKEYNDNDLECVVISHILAKYRELVDKVEKTEEGGEIDYYDVVAPFHRLLTDVCDLIAEYEFDLVDILKNIERDIEDMNQTTRHTMVEDYDSAMESLSDIETEEDDSTITSCYDNSIDPVEDPAEDPVEDPAEDPVEDPAEDNHTEIFLCDKFMEGIENPVVESVIETLVESVVENSIEDNHTEIFLCDKFMEGIENVLVEPLVEDNHKEIITLYDNSTEDIENLVVEKNETNVLFENGPEKCSHLYHCSCWINCHMWHIKKDGQRRSTRIEQLLKETTELIESSRIVREKSYELRKRIVEKYGLDE